MIRYLFLPSGDPTGKCRVQTPAENPVPAKMPPCVAQQVGETHGNTAMKDAASKRAARLGTRFSPAVRARVLLLVALVAISVPDLASAYSFLSSTTSEEETCPAESAACLADAKCYECFFVLSASAEACTPEGFEVDSATCDEKLQRTCCSIEEGEDCEGNAVLESYLGANLNCSQHGISLLSGGVTWAFPVSSVGMHVVFDLQLGVPVKLQCAIFPLR